MRRSFVLLEVLIALALIMLFSLPILNAPVLHLRHDLKITKEIEYETLIENVSNEIKLYLYRNSSLLKEEKIELSPFNPLIIKNLQDKEVFYKIRKVETQKKDKAHYLCNLKVYIKLHNKILKKAQYTIYIS